MLAKANSDLVIVVETPVEETSIELVHCCTTENSASEGQHRIIPATEDYNSSCDDVQGWLGEEIIQNQSTKTTIKKLPIELPDHIIELIFQYLPPQMVIKKCSIICKKWFALSHSDKVWEYFWITNQPEHIQQKLPFVSHTKKLPKIPINLMNSTLRPQELTYLDYYSRQTLSYKIWNKMRFSESFELLQSKYSSPEQYDNGIRFNVSSNLSENGILGIHNNSLDRATGTVRFWDLKNYKLERSNCFNIPHGNLRFKIISEDFIWTELTPKNFNQQRILSIYKKNPSYRPSKSFIRSQPLYKNDLTTKSDIPITCMDATTNCLFAGDAKGLLHLWKLPNGSVIAHQNNAFNDRGGRHEKAIQCCQYLPHNNMLFSSSLDKTTRLWDIRTGSSVHRIVHSAHNESLQFDQFDLFVGNFAGGIQQFDLRDLSKPIFTCKLNQRISSLHFDSHKVVASANRHVVIWDRKNLNLHRVALRSRYQINWANYYDEKLITSDESGSVLCWTPKLLPHLWTKSTAPPIDNSSCSIF